MKILSKGGIALALKAIEPTHIAVAYLGADWRDYLGDVPPAEIIVSPTLGTNPYALAEVGEAIGWENVFLLEALHAKIYLSNAGAIVGSANLTANGLQGERLEEVAVLLSDSQLIAGLRTEFQRLKAAAVEHFATKSDKIAAVHKLERLWRLAASQELVRLSDRDTKRSIADYVDGNEAFYVAWYLGSVLKFNDAALDAVFPDEVANGKGHPIGDHLTFLESDQIEKDKWILVWRAKSDGAPDRRSSPSWMYIDTVVENGVIDLDHGYTKLAFSRSDRGARVTPFELDDDFAAAFNQIIESRRYPEFSSNGWEEEGSHKVWSVEPTFPIFRRFIRDVQLLARSTESSQPSR